MSKFKITWQDFDKDIKILEKKLKIIEWRISGIYGIPRGGLIAAVLLSYRLNIPLIIDKNKITRNTLIIDDIVDSGNTVKRLLKLIGKKREDLTIVSLWYFPGSKIVPDIYINLKVDKWILFPWETLLTSKLDKTKI